LDTFDPIVPRTTSPVASPIRTAMAGALRRRPRMFGRSWLSRPIASCCASADRQAAAACESPGENGGHQNAITASPMNLSRIPLLARIDSVTAAK
jgi:hypothetical protein